jgi:hypothetical protein
MNRTEYNKDIYLSITLVIHTDHEEICLVCTNSSNSNFHNLDSFLFKEMKCHLSTEKEKK